MYDIYEALKTQVRDGASEFAVGPFLYSLVFILRAKRCLDLGTGHGFSMLAMGLALKEAYENPFPAREQHRQREEVDYAEFEKREKPLLVTVDYLKDESGFISGLINHYRLEDYVQVVNANVLGLSNRLPFSEWDLIFMDATKNREELIEYIPLVREGGFFVLHDYFAIGGMCKQLDELKELEGLLCDTGYMSFKVYRVNNKVSEEVVCKCLRK